MPLAIRRSSGYALGAAGIILLAVLAGVFLGKAFAAGCGGSSGPDNCYGNNSNENYDLQAGDDWAYMAGGADIIRGSQDKDVLLGQDGQDDVYGGPGNDRVQDCCNPYGLNGNGGNDYMSGGADLDYLFGNAGNNEIEGNEQDDVIWANNGQADIVKGGAGYDICYVDNGNETFVYECEQTL